MLGADMVEVCMPAHLDSIPHSPQTELDITNRVTSDAAVFDDFSLACRSQLKRRDEDFAGLQSVHDAVKGQLEQQNDDLSSKLSKVTHCA